MSDEDVEQNEDLTEEEDVEGDDVPTNPAEHDEEGA